MKETRVEKYANYRKEIESLDNNNEGNTNLKTTSTTKTLTYTVDDLLKKHDEYTMMIDSSRLSDKIVEEDERKKRELKRLILDICLYVFLGLLVVGIVITIIALLGGFSK